MTLEMQLIIIEGVLILACMYRIWTQSRDINRLFKYKRIVYLMLEKYKTKFKCYADDIEGRNIQIYDDCITDIALLEDEVEELKQKIGVNND